MQTLALPFTATTRVVHCACGAQRHAPVGLAVISCVHCGAAMDRASESTFVPPPSRALLVLATLPTQLLGAIGFALALVFIIKLQIRDTTTIAMLAVGTACVFAGGSAYRGSVVALVLCAALDVGIAIALLAQWVHAITFVSPPFGIAENQFALGGMIIGGIAAIVAAECLVAIPSVREFARWRDARR